MTTYISLLFPIYILSLGYILNLFSSSLTQNKCLCLIYGLFILITNVFISSLFSTTNPLYFICLMALAPAALTAIAFSRKNKLSYVKSKSIWGLKFFLGIISLFVLTKGTRLYTGYYEGHDINHYAKLAKEMTFKKDLLVKYRANLEDNEISADKHPPLLATILRLDFIFAPDPNILSGFTISKIILFSSLIILIFSFPLVLLEEFRLRIKLIVGTAFISSFAILQLFRTYHIDGLRLLLIIATFKLLTIYTRSTQGEKDTSLILITWLLIIGSLLHSIGLLWGVIMYFLLIMRIPTSRRVVPIIHSLIFILVTFPWYFLEYLYKGKL